MSHRLLVQNHIEKETKSFQQKSEKYQQQTKDIKKLLDSLNFQSEFYENIHQVYKIIQKFNLEEIKTYERTVIQTCHDFDANCLYYSDEFLPLFNIPCCNISGESLLDAERVTTDLNDFIFSFRELTFEFIDNFPLKLCQTTKELVEIYNINEILKHMKEIESSIQIILSILTDEKLLDFIEVLSSISNQNENSLNDILNNLNCFNDLSLSNEEKKNILINESKEMLEKNFLLNLHLKNLKKYEELHFEDFQNFIKLLQLFRKSLDVELLDKLIRQTGKIEKFFKKQKSTLLEIISPEISYIYEFCFSCCFFGESQFMIDSNDLFQNLRNFLNLNELSLVLDELNQFSFDNTFFHSDIFIKSINESNEDFLLEIDKSYIMLNQMKSIYDIVIEKSIDHLQIDYKNELYDLMKQQNIQINEDVFFTQHFNEIINNLKFNIEKDDLKTIKYISSIEQEKYVDEEKSKTHHTIDLEMTEYHPQIHNDISINSEIEIDIMPQMNEYHLQEQQKLLSKESYLAVGIAISDYFAQQDGELSFNEGDVIFVLNKKINSSWWFGMVNNEEGYFPSNFFEEKKITKAIHDYDAQDENELTFKEGDIIAILEEDEDGWYIGALNGKIGQFPVNFTSAGL
eukprot:gene11642-4883_t